MSHPSSVAPPFSVVCRRLLLGSLLLQGEDLLRPGAALGLLQPRVRDVDGGLLPLLRELHLPDKLPHHLVVEEVLLGGDCKRVELGQLEGVDVQAALRHELVPAAGRELLLPPNLLLAHENGEDGVRDQDGRHGEEEERGGILGAKLEESLEESDNLVRLRRVRGGGGEEGEGSRDGGLLHGSLDLRGNGRGRADANLRAGGGGLANGDALGRDDGAHRDGRDGHGGHGFLFLAA
mmetsp:Transcript_4955/g.18564  ORF Transcript_4955/g.18564 Transcript_4955/m.18564 type:complete len:235 (-) Transcript_4955:22-726(-)